MRKQGLCLLIILCMVLTLLCGCSFGGTKTSEATKGSTVASKSNEPPTELKMLVMSAGGEPKDLQLVLDEVNKIAVEKTNTKLSMNVLNLASYMEQVRLSLASNEKLDLILSGLNFEYTQEVDRGQLAPLDDLLEKYGSGIKEVLTDKYINVGRYKGKIYAVPSRHDFAKGGTIAFDKALLDKYNLDISKIEKIEDIEPLLETIKKNEPNVIPIVADRGATPAIAPLPQCDYLIGENGPVLLYSDTNKELNVVNLYESEEYANNAKIAHRWYNKGYISKDILTNTLSGSELIKAGRAFCFSTNAKPDMQSQIEAATGKEIAVADLKTSIAFSSTSNIIGFMWAIPKQSNVQEAAMKFLNLLYTDSDVINLMDWGIEGKHYVKVDDKTIKYPDGLDAAKVGYSMNMNWVWGDQFKSYVLEGTSPTLWDEMQKFNEEAPLSYACGFLMDTSQVKNEMASITNVVKQYHYPISTGVVDPETKIPEFLSKLKAAGEDKLVQESQKQLNEWYQSNKK